jgi:hypothetical protein
MVAKNIFSTSFLRELTKATNNQQVEQVDQPFDINVFIYNFNLLFWS